MKTKDEAIKILQEALQAASDHLDYCGYGDSWESQVQDTLEPKITEALEMEIEK